MRKDFNILDFNTTRVQNKQGPIKLHRSRILIHFKTTTFQSAHKYGYILHLLKHINQQL